MHSLSAACSRPTAAANTIRYDTIAEFNVDSKAEYSASVFKCPLNTELLAQ